MEGNTQKEDNRVVKGLDIVGFIFIVIAIIGVVAGFSIGNLIIVLSIVLATIIFISILIALSEIIRLLDNLNKK